MTVAENQESSLKSRRRLAETPRGMFPVHQALQKAALHVGDKPQAYQLPAEFKKAATPELNRDVGTLLKAYQEEVDRLTTRYTSAT